MPQFKPFKGIRPVKEIAGFFSTKSVDNYSEEELVQEVTQNLDSFLHIIKPTWEESSLETDEKHKKVSHNLQEFLKTSKSDLDKPSFYIYQLTKPSKEQVRGIVGLVHMKDYEAGKIKKHEETLTKRVNLFANYLSNIHFHAEPVLLTYPHNQRIDLLMDVEMKRLPVAAFKDKQENQHQLWQVENRLNLQQIKDSIEKYETLYIADGHHRMESSLVYSQKMMEEIKGATDSDHYNYTMAMLVSDKELIIRDYNRLLKDLNEHDSTEFLNKLSEKFDIAERGENPFFPSKKHNLGLYLDGKFYSLFVKKENLTVQGLSELDTYLFEELVLKPILNIQDSRVDDRIDFIRGTGDLNGIKNIKAKVDAGKFRAGFFFYPVASHDLEKIADLGLKMPPKSTYIEPKPLSGLTIFQLKE
ncbi:DUF1015 domain-containing protein [Moheibacter lacus]|uniref:DUF1015 domain-containing protein n=1 Tax=Moheibacter lacus TaxID=2745851 RepID=A0A838ZKI2_9FLAO|nr:DUF1015 domain-containing protein [Moheibacter lacus]MBA5629758.1 DUF1015 domain-containing protein [Moheibacter lacus]